MSYTALIQPGELASLMQEQPTRLVICDCSFDLADPAAGQAAFDAGHIPGAAYFGLDAVLSGATTGHNGRHPLPGRDVVASALAARGAEAGSQIVAYDAADGMFAARLWWLVRWLGHAEVAVLDGGLAAWQRDGHPVTAEPTEPRPRGGFAERPSLVPTVDYATLASQATTGRRFVIDARAPDRFRGENETLDRIGGHIPGAHNRHFRNNLDPQGRFKSASELHVEFATLLGDAKVDTVVSQCGSGVTACHNLLAMEVAGLPGGTLYPGSWSEWSAQPAAPIAAAPPPGPTLPRI